MKMAWSLFSSTESDLKTVVCSSASLLSKLCPRYVSGSTASLDSAPLGCVQPVGLNVYLGGRSMVSVMEKSSA